MARFNNNMFQDGYEPVDMDMSGIMNPELADVIEMRKEANAARDGANDQYTADVADYKNNEATAAEQGVASLPEAQDTNQFYNNNVFANTKFPIGPNGEPMFVGEDIDYTGMGGSPINTTYTEPNIPFVPVSTNPYTNVLANIPGEPEPAPYYDPYIAEEPVYVPPVETVAPVYQTPTANSTDDTSTYIPPSTNSSSPAIGDIDSETGLVWDGGTFVRPTTWNDNQIDISYVWNGSDWVAGSGTGLPDLGIVDPNAGANSGDGGLINNSDTGGDTIGTGTDSGDVYDGNPNNRFEGALPPPTPAPIINTYTNRPVTNPYQVFEQPTTPSNYTRPMTADVFGGSPGITTAPLATYAGLDSTSYTPPATPELAASQLAASLEPFLPPDDDEDNTATTPPGMNQGGRVPMGNNNTLNSGLSRLPINLQNDTLTQVFQSGFRPRR